MRLVPLLKTGQSQMTSKLFQFIVLFFIKHFFMNFYVHTDSELKVRFFESIMPPTGNVSIYKRELGND